MKHALAIACLIAIAPLARAATFTGSLADPTNTALVARDLGAARFGDDAEIANNVALYDLVVPVASSVTVRSTGRAAGGIDPYVTLFAGSGTGATFAASNYDQAFSTGGDFTITASLSAGDYRIAVGAFANMSFAENLGTGTLADGFIGLGGAYALGDGRYALEVTLATAPPVTPVPEPATTALMLLGLAAIASAGAHRGRRARVAARF